MVGVEQDQILIGAHGNQGYPVQRTAGEIERRSGERSCQGPVRRALQAQAPRRRDDLKELSVLLQERRAQRLVARGERRKSRFQSLGDHFSPHFDGEGTVVQRRPRKRAHLEPEPLLSGRGRDFQRPLRLLREEALQELSPFRGARRAFHGSFRLQDAPAPARTCRRRLRESSNTSAASLSRNKRPPPCPSRS